MVRVLLAAVVLVAAAVPASALDLDANIRVNQIRNATPPCGPGAGPYVGRVSGFVGFDGGGRLANFEGCFTSVGACNAWRLAVNGEIDGRIVYDRCETR